MPKGGARPGAGRPKGGRNKRTAEMIAKAEAGGLMPLDYMLGVMRDEANAPAARLDAAKSAAPYIYPKLAQVGVDGDGEGGPIKHVIAWQSDDDQDDATLPSA